ncbi:MAG: arginine--tRNA ligase [Patescibacteria group bacterium]|nr:arginine--tRNA ligase [Patescibacteria group bacterium]
MVEKIKEKITKKFQEAINQITEKKIKIDQLEIPPLLDFGDFSTTVSFSLARILKKDPMTIGSLIKNHLKNDRLIEKVDLVKPGYLNFWISKEIIFKVVDLSAKGVFLFPPFHFGNNKRIMIEFAQPNTHKLFHIGHFRNISLGESLARILEAVGNRIIRANYQGDVGLHIAKCIYQILTTPNYQEKVRHLQTLEEKMAFIGKMYTLGTKAYEESPKAQREIVEINKKIYHQDKDVFHLWQETRNWSLEYFDKIYQRLDTHFDKLYFESEMSQSALETCQRALQEKILEKSDGAIIFRGKEFGLDNRVFINSLGYPTYEGKELALAEREFSDFGDLDKNIHVVTPEQTSFFKVTFKVEELINPKINGKQYHLAYEWVKLKTGKMSSREGNIIETNWLIDKIKQKIAKSFNVDEKVAETLAVASAKYSFLKNSHQTPINFDIDESINLSGNSACYLIYTYVRGKSILKKIGVTEIKDFDFKNLEPLEHSLARKIFQFPEVVFCSGKNLSPNIIATYLYELASLFNLFYQKLPVIKSKIEKKTLRLLLTKATVNVIKKGLFLLGIRTVEKM